ncbi:MULTISPECIES: DMT family transporter [unclassified Treponema]|uniref:DMT family transporter n=1 Tax=unclassified Treponema TaxID=2638727 RepID=UPI0020A46911|nr:MULTISPECIES: DMT family transporter [unclassified Treponema]UTC67603.1 DMT family transporter [Treponema sp. OMZ 789]UTC70330.1 DMT family transporter [Treponema sp. OMZ 790]UTC73045.1 DMT family transporter [Treponema sp. OMZ 791]
MSCEVEAESRTEVFVCRRTKILSRLALFSATLLWGSTFVAVSSTNDFFKPNFLLACRFLPACLILCAVFFRRLKKIDRRYLKAGFVLGLIMFVGYSLQAVAITTAGGLPGRSSFLVATYCVLVPFVNAVVLKRKPDKFNVFAAFLCFAGILAISMPDLILESSNGVNWGDVLSIISSFIFAVYIVLLPKFMEKLDAALITIVQFAFAGSYALIFSLLFEDNSGTIWNYQSVFTLVYLTVLCTALCVLLQAVGQRNTPPATAALIFSLESVFSIFLSIMLTDEKFTFALALGCSCIFVAIIISETKLSFLRKNRGK